MNIYEKLSELGLAIPKAPEKGGVYSPYVKFSDSLIYVSGCGPTIGNKSYEGKVGDAILLDEAKDAARDAMLNVLAVLDNAVGDINRIKPVKILVFVASSCNFYRQPEVANGASQLLADLYGNDNVPSRSAIGVSVLPGNIPVEIEGLFEVI